MLNEEQKKAFEKGFELYQKTCYEWEDELCDERLDLLAEALETMGEYINEVDDIYYKIIFANIIHDMQKSKQFELSSNCEAKKVQIYLQTLDWFSKTDSYNPRYAGFIQSVLNNLAQIFLSGIDGIEQNDKYARFCYINVQRLGTPLSKMSADIMLKCFAQDDSGNWIFTSKRPIYEI